MCEKRESGRGREGGEGRGREKEGEREREREREKERAQNLDAISAKLFIMSKKIVDQIESNC